MEEKLSYQKAGVDIAVVDEKGREVKPGQKGFVIIRKPWPGMMVNIHGDPERFNDPVREAMHTNFLVVEPTLALRNLVAMLDVQPYAAVMDQGQFHGLITRADVLNYLRRQMTATAAH